MTRIKIILFILFACMIFANLAGCKRDVVIDEYANIPDEKWDRTKPIQFSFLISDTNQPNDLYINIRNTTAYRFSNVYLFLNTRFPNGKTARDTIECILATTDGKWIGKGYSGIKENKILLRKGMKFHMPGTYQLTIEQAMRTDILEGISDIGISIQKQ